MLFYQDTYTGDGQASRAVTGIPFQPDLVLVKDITSGANMIFRTADMPATESLSIRENIVALTTGILSLDANGFTVGNNDRANKIATNFVYQAFKDDGQGDFNIFTYTGNGADDRAITGLGFSPCFALTKGNNVQTGIFRYSNAPANSSSVPFGGTNASGGFKTMDADGFTLGTNTKANEDAIEYYGFAFKAVSGRIAVFTYTGNGIDDRSITSGINFKPDLTLIKGNSTGATNYRSSEHSGDSSQAIDATVATNGTQSFLSGGIQVGTGTTVNADTVVYYGLAIALSVGTHIFGDEGMVS